MNDYGPHVYGSFYWCVKVPKALAKSGEIYVFADGMEALPNGALLCRGKEGHPNLILAPGQWLAVYAASALDGSAVAVQVWEGEVIR